MLEPIYSRIAFFIVPVLICAALIPLYIRIAMAWGIVDKPNARKQHAGHVPLVGGFAVFTSAFVAMYIFMPNSEYLPMMGIASVLVLTGVLDDYFDLSSGSRFFIQIVAAILMIVIADNKISSVGNLIGTGPVLLSIGFGFAFTILCTVGVINAVNMLDGMDGLAGVTIFISFTGLGLLAWLGGHSVIAQQLLIFNSALLAFLFFNMRLLIPRAIIFLGDSGSMFLGFILCWYSLKLSQGAQTSLSPVSAGWIFGLPLADIIVVIVHRISNGRSPFSADRDHLHHLLLDTGMTVNKTLATLAAVHGLMVAIGIFVVFAPQLEPILFWIFIVIVLFHYFIIAPRLRKLAYTKNISAQ